MMNTGTDDIVIEVQEPKEREYQCVECGTVVKSKLRPSKCPDCNTVNSDLKSHLQVMIPREACGWFE